MKLYLSIIVFFMLISNLFSQGFAVKYKNNDKIEKFKIKELKIETKIFGTIAETEINATIFNPFNRTLEGELLLPLPEGAFLSNYALDVNGVMVDGVVIKKKKARVVFEDIVRQGVDPGLAEVISGNNFKTRIYPFNPKGVRRIRLKYICKLKLIDKHLVLNIPLDIKEKIDEFELKIEKYNKLESSKKKPNKIDDINLSGWSLFKEFKKKNYEPPKNINILLPYKKEILSVSEQDGNGDYYFLSSVYFNNNLKTITKKSLKNITVFWDSSLSMNNSKHKKSIEFLRTFLRKSIHTIKNINLIIYNKEVEFNNKYKGNIKNINKITGMLENIKYDGATSLRVLNKSRNNKSDVYLLFTDGIINYNENLPQKFDAPLYVFSDNKSNDYSILNYLAKQNNGIFFDLNYEKTEEILSRINKPVLSVISAKIIKGKTTELYPAIPFPVKNPIIITGRLISNEALIELSFGYGNRIIKKSVFKIKKNNNAKGKVIRTFWAQNKIEDLLVFKDMNKTLIQKLGIKYGLITPFTSMLVLDSLEQYLRYEIKPPKTLPEIYKKYIKVMKINRYKKEGTQNEDNKINDVINTWKNKIEWWKKDFKLPPIEKKKKTITRQNHTSRDSSSANNRNREFHETEEGVNIQGHKIIYGFVLTDDGEKIPGVLIKLIPSNSEHYKETVTNEQGFFRFDNVEHGRYKIIAALEGFKDNKAIIYFRTDKLKKIIKLLLMEIREEITVEGSSVDYEDDGVEGVVEDGMMNSNIISNTGNNNSILKRKTDKVFIKLKHFISNTKYIDKIKNAKNKYETYLKLRKGFFNSPSFYMDCADFFVRIKKHKLGMKILSNLLELSNENPTLLRIYAYRLEEYKEYKLSEMILQRVLKLREEEPQSYRDLALIKAKTGKYYQAISLLYEIVKKKWRRFQDIELIALTEMNDLIRIAKSKGIRKLPEIDKRFIKMLDVDLRIVLSWDTNNIDIDLWVIEPDNEKVFYEHKLSKTGGRISRDYTAGYGPEEYMIKKALKGKYIIKANYYGNNSAKLFGPVTLKVKIFTNYGRKNERERIIILRLKDRKEVIKIGEVNF